MPNRDHQPGSYLSLTESSSHPAFAKAAQVSYAHPQQSLNPNKHRVYWQSACHMCSARLYTTFRQSCWEPNKEGTSKKLVTGIQLGIRETAFPDHKTVNLSFENAEDPKDFSITCTSLVCDKTLQFIPAQNCFDRTSKKQLHSPPRHRLL